MFAIYTSIKISPKRALLTTGTSFRESTYIKAKMDLSNLSMFSANMAGGQPLVSDVAIKMSLNVTLIVTTLLGNGSILLLLKRFRCLRTVPNILIANLACVDMLNVLVNLPVNALVGIMELHHVVKGRLTSACVASAQTAFVFLNLLGMGMMMLDRLLVIRWGLRYKFWMTTKKVCLTILGMWLVTIALITPWLLNLYKVNLGDAPTFIYRMIYYYMVGDYVTFIRCAFAALYILLGMLTWKSLKDQTKKYDGELSLPEQQRLKLQKSRRQTEVHAAVTVGLTVLAYVLSCVPLIVYGVLAEKASSLVSSDFLKWFGLFANYSQYVSSACNPFIYMARCNRFNRALKALWRDPCGSRTMTNVSPAMHTAPATASVVSLPAVEPRNPVGAFSEKSRTC
ncbi:neuropeptide SIFamide receptor [Nematostella vectensis]|uniref:neuropeptide SIFamide receptor n=1 Tax=Nematostella vectensis TaxID=45351 RepID=UPI0013901CBA|nr:neuropeptide SIFamide receptor [Nematostella vectensis]